VPRAISPPALAALGALIAVACGSQPEESNAPPAPTRAPGEVARLAAGGTASCARFRDGRVHCWGEREARDPPGAPGFEPRRVGPADRLFGGLGGTCALRRDGSARCWRYEWGGARLADDRVSLLELPAVREIAVGAYEACAREESGALWCWGRDNSLLFADRPREHPPARVAIDDAVRVAVGEGHACAARSDGTLWCWGDNYRGQLGDGTIEVRTAPVQVRSVANVGALALGDNFTCASEEGGALSCWGSTKFERPDARDALAQPVGSLRVIALAAQRANVCAIAHDRSIWCWCPGRGEPERVHGIESARALALGEGVACALEQSGSLLCWRFESHTARAYAPMLVRGDDIAEVALRRDEELCVRGESGDVRCAEIELPREERRVDPRPRRAITDAIEIFVGPRETCARRADSSVWCWNGPSDRGRERADLRGAEGIALGEDHGCAFWPDGTARCFGANDRGQLGDGTRLDRSEPVPVADLVGVVELDVGARHSCARTREGAVYCWGDNANGSLAREREGSNVPVRIPIERAEEIASGRHHVCARTASRELWCWGRSLEGQLGPRIVAPVRHPLHIRSVGSISAIAAAGDGTCVISDRAVYCTTTVRRGNEVRHRFARVRGTSAVHEIAMGDAHVCARFAARDVRCWGDNRSGQLGRDLGSIVELVEESSERGGSIVEERIESTEEPTPVAW
jgi:alpha-tubulin suppressor-like RCC1 family protein